MHLKGVREASQRTAFTLFIDPKAVSDIRHRRNAKALTSRKDYAALDIKAVGPNTGERRAISFYFDQSQGSILWTDFDLPIRWTEVA